MLLQYTIDEVENLIKKHEAFEKAAAAQEERFAALERLTTVGENMFSFFPSRGFGRRKNRNFSLRSSLS